MSISLSIETSDFKIAGEGFAISRGRRTHARVVMVTLAEEGIAGRGECVPYARYGETPQSVSEQIASISTSVENGSSRAELQTLLPAGAARNALDCALWDLEAKQSGKTAAELAGLAPLSPRTTAFTLSVDTPEKMGNAARQAAERPLLKVKLSGAGDDERIMAVRNAAPRSTLIVDANEAWDEGCFEKNMAACIAAGVALIEQPLPAGQDDFLAQTKRPVPVCADESLHTSKDIAALVNRYDAVNIKLDKAGGLTEALNMVHHARSFDLKIMLGCMLGTSLAMAPAVVAAQQADFIDLDGPLLLAEDRSPALQFEGSTLYPPTSGLWG